MNGTPIRTVIYIEDSDDEVFLARRLLRRWGASMDLIHFERFDQFESAIDTGLTIDSQTSILVIELNLNSATVTKPSVGYATIGSPGGS